MSSSEKKSSCSVLGVLQVILIVLKLVGSCDVFNDTFMESFGKLPWKFVLIPLWISLGIVGIILVIAIIALIIEAMNE